MTPAGSFRRIALAILVTLAALPSWASSPWQTLAGCRLVDHPANDGDSFRVRWKGNEYTFRVYLVDAPETRFSHSERVQAQADYFGITVEQAMEVGQMAREFVHERLQHGFTVRTRWHGVFGHRRHYARVMVDGVHLADLLVANGLARIHGMGLAGKTDRELARLRALEKTAQAQGRGAWGLAQEPAKNDLAVAHPAGY